jgi:deazaflavin-dependent oxidoreductase (nitroreductase family)
MPTSQSTLDRVRVFNKYVTNKLLIHIAGRDFGHFAILTHEGRKSGKKYRIPVIAEPLANGFVIALTYGKKVDWYENIKAKGGGSLYWKHKEYTLVNPQFIDPEAALPAFPPRLQPVLRRKGIEYFLKLEIQQGTGKTAR